MNSRDAAYDEEELIRRAIEESKADTKSNADETDTLMRKRSRSDSVTCVSLDQTALARDFVADGLARNREGAKRPRTTSPSPGAVSKHSNSASHPPSDDESKTKPVVNGIGNGTRRQRAPSRSQFEKEPTKEADEVEIEAPDTASRRKERINRRKGDGE
jgi:hypothetical protein